MAGSDPRPEDDPGSFGESFAKAITRQVHEELLAELAGERGERGERRRRKDAPSKPEGIVTIVFTDIEDSSGLVSRLGDQGARDRVRRHDDVLREVARANDGVEIERAGDGFMIAFSTATKALAFAVDLQRRISGAAADDGTAEHASLRVRVGMETGEVIAEEQGYFGRTVFQASRIADVAVGGQIVVSQATRLIGSPSGLEFRDIGEHELKGLGGQHRLYDVGWRDAS